MASVAIVASNKSLVPTADPRLKESLEFENS
jgi:hypothetical protein